MCPVALAATAVTAAKSDIWQSTPPDVTRGSPAAAAQTAASLPPAGIELAANETDCHVKQGLANKRGV
jgi:hypothetical protein